MNWFTSRGKKVRHGFVGEDELLNGRDRRHRSQERGLRFTDSERFPMNCRASNTTFRPLLETHKAELDPVPPRS